jgi:hypothetical protein
MKKQTPWDRVMKTTTILGLGGLGFVLLVLLTIVLAGGWIEDDLAERSREELVAVGQDWAEVEMSGRDAYLTGTAPDAEAAKQAADAIASIWGMRVVDDRTEKP